MRHLPAVPEGVPGLEAVWELEHVLLGDRRVPDLYRLDDIAGLDDADVRDSRYDNPSEDGELLGIARYGGRSLVFTGRIEAGNVAMMRRLGRDLSRTVDELTERRLYARTVVPGICDDFFYEDHWTGHSVLAGAKTNISWERGRVRSTGAGAVVTRQDRLSTEYGNADVIAHFRVPSIGAAGIWGCVLPGISSSSYLYGRFGGDGLLEVGTDAGALSSTAISWTSTEFWIRLRKTGNVIRVEIWDEDPTERQQLDDNYHEHTLTAGAASEFGSGVRGAAGVRWSPADADEILWQLRVLPREDRDVSIMVRKSQSLQRRENQRSPYARRDFMLTMRASQPMFESAVLQEVTVDEVVPATRGRVYDRTYDLDYQEAFLDTTGSEVTPPAHTSAWNYGDATARPIYRIYGPCSDPEIKDDLTGLVMQFDGDLVEGEYWEIDTAAHTIYDNNGDSQFAARRSGSGWLLMSPGETRFRLIANGYESATKLTVVWRHTWKGG